MSYSSLIQVLPEAWRSSNGIAALASIGIHLIAMVTLPLVEFNSPEINSQQTIGLVELSPEELSRLPQVAPQQNPLPSASLQDDLPPLPSSPAFPSNELPPLPPPTFLPPPPPLNTPPSYQSLPPQIPVAQIPLPPPPQSESPSEQIPAPELSQKLEQELAPPPPNAVLPSPNLPSVNGLRPGEPLSPPAERQIPPQQNNNQTQQQVAANIKRGTQSPTRTALPEQTKQELIARRNAIAKEKLATNKTGNSNNDRTQRLAALQQRLQQPSNRANATPTNDRTQRLATLQQRLQQPSASNNPRSLSRATRQTIAQIDALKEVQQANPTAAIQPTIRNTIKTCNKQLDGGVAVLAAIVGPEGKIISGPDLLSKNTPVAVQRAAMTLVKGYKFPKNSQPINQPFRLEFTYNPGICPAASKQ